MGYGQHDSILKVSLVNKIDGEIKDFTTDNLRNIYLLNATNQIKKVNDRGDSIAVYNDVRRFGKICSIDATNPLKILVFYKDFSTIVVLDRLLNSRAVIDLRKQNILQVAAVTSSYDNNIWLYDELDNKLKKIDDNGNLLLESSDFRQVFDSVPLPSSMYDRDGQLYLYDPSKGLLVFDYYGAKKNAFQILHLSDLQVLDKNTITARDSTHIILYKPRALQLSSFTAFNTLADFKKIKFNGSKIYCLNKNGTLEIYSVAGQ
ncbi:hypothetical protein [Segetibacter koreensis]|uniref:hypothetical protein n=1 Tax=Segetibacter koreensis TaxID=398037 RepID=UPI000377D9DE|nr:hypothetical protein [Segetibacter koreensis]